MTNVTKSTVETVILDGAVSQDFLWGAATGAHQTEGNNVASNWWALEHRSDTFVREPSGDAVDSYHRWAEDMDIAAGAGLRDYRFGIEWSRVEPEDGRVSLAAIAHYQRMVSGCRQRGLRPFVTLHHFTVPRWFADSGGWLRDDAVQRFTGYVEAVLPALAGVRHIGTINEPNMVAMFATLSGGGPDQLAGGLPLPDPRVAEVMVAAHRKARETLKAALPEAMVGWGVSVQDVQALSDATDLVQDYVEARDEVFLRAAVDDDWVGVQTYTRIRLGNNDGAPVEVLDDQTRTTLSGWEYYPSALGGAVRRVALAVPGVQIIVTENGIATADDDERIDYTRGALRSLRSAISDGVEVGGYLHWSLLDNYEWGDYQPTFGLVAVDRTTFVRTPKPSLNWLGAQRPTR